MPRPQIRPGWLLLGLSVFAIIVIIFVVGVSVFRTRTAEKSVVHVGGEYWRTPREPEWLRQLLGDGEIAGIDKVHAVDLEDSRINDENFPALIDQLEQFDQLNGLSLNGLSLSDHSLSYLKRLSNLNELHLSNTTITNRGLEHLSELKKLNILALDRTEIGDNGLKFLSKLEELQYLNLDHTRVTDQGMTHLKQLKNLSELSLSDTEVTEEGLLQLEASVGALSVSDD